MTGAAVTLHTLLADALVLYAVVLGIWGTYLYFRREKVTPGFRSSFLGMAGLTVLQSLAGLGTLATGGHLDNPLHVVYGVFSVLFLPGVYVYAHGGTARREAMFLAGACWIVLIAYLRGFATG